MKRTSGNYYYADQLKCKFKTSKISQQLKTFAIKSMCLE